MTNSAAPAIAPATARSPTHPVSGELIDFAVPRIEQVEGIALFLWNVIDRDMVPPKSAHDFERIAGLCQRRVDEIIHNPLFDRHASGSVAAWVDEVFDIDALLRMLSVGLTEDGETFMQDDLVVSTVLEALVMAAKSAKNHLCETAPAAEAPAVADNDDALRWNEIHRPEMIEAVARSVAGARTPMKAGARFKRELMRELQRISKAGGGVGSDKHDLNSMSHAIQAAFAAAAYDVPAGSDAKDFMFGFSMALAETLSSLFIGIDYVDPIEYDPVEGLVDAGWCEIDPPSTSKRAIRTRPVPATA